MVVSTSRVWGAGTSCAIRCEALREGLVRFGAEGGQGPAISISMGVATWSEDTGDAHELMRRADMALLRAKAAGRNRVCPAIMGE